MAQIRSTYKYMAVILAGFIIFLLDYYELTNSFVNEFILFGISLLKSAYFIYFVFKNIKESSEKDFDFREFMSFAVTTILLVVLSFAIDYYCLFRINPEAFIGILPHQSIAAESINFIYYSISVFTTAGFGDIKPNSTSGQIFVSMELLIAFFFTIFVIANVAHLRSSFQGRSKKHNDLHNK